MPDTSALLEEATQIQFYFSHQVSANERSRPEWGSPSPPSSHSWEFLIGDKDQDQESAKPLLIL